MKKIENGYSLLASAVINNAIEDYRTALKALLQNPDSTSARTLLDELNEFFNGEDFEFYCDLSGMNSVYLKEKLKEASENDQ